jgi:hypothetical protein
MTVVTPLMRNYTVQDDRWGGQPCRRVSHRTWGPNSCRQSIPATFLARAHPFPRHDQTGVGAASFYEVTERALSSFLRHQWRVDGRIYPNYFKE